MNGPPYLDAATVFDAVGWADAIAALEAALLDGLDPTEALSRSVLDLRHGQLLMMPAETEAAAGVKLTTLAPGNAELGLPRIQGLYVLYDPKTLTPVVLLEGAALTTLRTPAVSAVAVKHLAHPEARSVVVFGCGPQAMGHIEAIRAVRPIERVTVVGRRPEAAREFADRLASTGLLAATGTPDAVSDADIVVCATTAREPVFDGRLLPEQACVVAVGSHEPAAREIDDTTLQRAQHIVVETADVALREAGDIIMAENSGALDRSDLLGLSAVLTGSSVAGISVFKSVGMGWQDLVLAQAVYKRWVAS